MAKQPYDKHLPTWAWTVAGLVNERAEVRFFCPRCTLLFDVDLGLIARVRGRSFSLVHHTPRCKMSCCRSLGFFVAACGMHAFPIVLMRNDPRDMAAKILQLLDDPARRAVMGTFGRRRVENELSWAHEAPKLLSAYAALARRSWAVRKGAGEPRVTPSQARPR